MAGASITDKSMQGRKIRVLLCVSVLDGHDRGLKYIAKKIAEAGMEVVYVTYEDVEEIAMTAVQEYVDVIGVSTSTGGHMVLFADLLASLRSKKLGHILVIGGGVVPSADIPRLREMGVMGIFGPGTHGDKVVEFIKEKRESALNAAS